MEPFNNTPLDKVNRLYSDYRGAGFDKSTILRKLKAQFSGAKFTFKGATLYVAFGDNPAQKVTGGAVVTNAATRLTAESLTERAAVMRDRVKQAGIKARVRVAPGGGEVQVFPPKYGIEFTDQEQETIATIAVELGYTFVRKQPIDPKRYTNPHGFNLYSY